MAFKKGQIPWNKGDKGLKPWMNTDGLKLGHLHKKGRLINKNYGNIHYWVRNKLGNPKVCKICGTKKGRIEWANIDHKYSLNINDYVSMCKKCHTKYDYDNHLCNKGCRWGSIPNKIGGGYCVV